MAASKSKKYKLDKVAIRMVKEPPLYSSEPVTSTSDAVRVLADAFKDMDREVLAVVSLRNDLVPINMSIVSMGTINACLAHPREIMKVPILSNAARIILMHNHPSGNLTPSPEDIALTDHMMKVCELIEIPMLDHIILGGGDRYYSFRERGELPVPDLKYAVHVSDLQFPPIDGVVSEATVQYNREDAVKKREAAMAAITDKLEKGVHDVFESSNYKQFLSCMSKFHNYSLNNILLIMCQKPDASLVAGYQSWQRDHKRYVKKGEKGIQILAPTPYKVKLEQDKIDADTHQKVLDDQGNPVKETIEVERPAFRIATVFDVSQTDGEPLPSLGVDELTGSVEHYGEMHMALMDIAKVPIIYEQIKGGAKGYYSPAEQKIAINYGMSEVQTLKTMVHEIAHSELHNREVLKNLDKPKDNHTKEVEAESVAFCVCAHYGIADAGSDSVGDYSFAYIAGWSSGKETPELKASLQTIRDTACMLIDRIDARLAEMQMDKSQEAAISMISESDPLCGKKYAEGKETAPVKSGGQRSCIGMLSKMQDKTVLKKSVPKPMRKHCKDMGLD